MSNEYKHDLTIKFDTKNNMWFFKGIFDNGEFPNEFKTAVFNKIADIYDETELCIYYIGGGVFYLATKNPNGYSDNSVTMLRVSEDVIRLENEWGQVIDYNLKDDEFNYIDGERNIHNIYSYYQL